MRLLRLGGIIAVSFVVSLIVFFIVVDNVVMPYLVDVERVRVPRLVGLSVSEAESRLRKRGLRLADPDSVYSEAVSAGTIVDQTPEAGASIKEARRVFVDVSRGQRLYVVPDVRERSLREAELQLRGSQLRIGNFVYVSSSSIPEGAVISQRPAGGTRQLSGHKIVLEVSSGSAFTRNKQVPDLSMLPIEQVEDTLRKYELRLGSIRYQIDNSRPPDRMLKQDPAAGSQVMRHTEVELVVSVSERSSAWFDSLEADRERSSE